MAKINTLPKNIALTCALSSVFLSSCALPPREAWQQIQEEGLIPYLSHNEEKPAAAPATRKTSPSQPQSPAIVSGPPGPAALPTATPAPATPAPANSEKALTAQAVPNLPGFVRSPYTNPPRLVDVKGTSPGATMICPYTQRPFIIPQEYVNPGSMLAEKTGPEINLVSKNKAKQDQPPVVVTNNSVAPKKTAPQSSPSKPAPSPAVVLNNNPVANPQPKPQPAPVVAPEPVKPVAQDIPYGQAIAGRPGFVNSPFAAKHQLVDVTGLPAGMEVKCPYTGKLFRVPQQETATAGIKKEAESPATSAPVEKK